MRVLLGLLVAVAICVMGSDAFMVKNPSTSFVSKKSAAGALHMTVLTYGNKRKDFKPGSKLSQACSALGVKPRYSCKK